MQWFIGLVIDLVKGLGYSEIIGFKTSFSVFLLLSLMSYIFFLIINKKLASILEMGCSCFVTFTFYLFIINQKFENNKKRI
jgi:hypothetical protein